MKKISITITFITLLSFAWACSDGDTTITEDGLEITDLHVGSGEEARAMDFLTIHFELSVENGDILESTYDRDEPIVVQVGSGQLPIEGWDRGMIGMREGGRRSLVIPPELAFGQEGVPGFIPGGENIHFNIELLSITKAPEPWEYNEADLQTTESGLQYVIHEQGDDEKPEAGDTVSVHYSGYLEDGTMFDSSLLSNAGNPVDFPIGVGSVIPGWDEGLLEMGIGEKRTLIIPPDLGYGEQGAGHVIPPNSTLIFDVELVAVY